MHSTPKFFLLLLTTRYNHRSSEGAQKLGDDKDTYSGRGQWPQACTRVGSVIVLQCEAARNLRPQPRGVQLLVLDDNRSPINCGKNLVVNQAWIVPAVEGQHLSLRDAEEVFFQRLAVRGAIPSPASIGVRITRGTWTCPLQNLSPYRRRKESSCCRPRISCE